MNPEQPTRDEIESRLTALLLGELPEDEARLLRWAITQDAGLAKLHDQLKRATGLVREVSVKPASPDAALKLSAERRKKLLAHFKTPRPAPKELFWLKRLKLPALVPALATVAIIAMLAAMFLPALSKSKSAARRSLSLNMASARMKSASESAVDENVPASVPASPAPIVLVPPPQTEIVLPKTEGSSGWNLGAAAIPLQNGEPQQVAPVLQNMFASSSPSRGGVSSSQNSALQQRQQSTATSMGAATTRSGITGIAGAGGGGAGGFDGRGGGEASVLDKRVDQFGVAEPTPTDSTGTLGWNDSGTDRSRAENQPNGGDAWQPPAKSFELADDGAVFNGAVAASQNRAVEGEKFYRNTAGEPGADKTPFWGDLPVAGRMFQSASRVTAPVVAPLPAAAPAESKVTGFAFDAGSDVTVPGTPAPADGFFLADSTAPQNLGEEFRKMSNASSGTMALNGVNAYTGEMVVNSGALSFDTPEAAGGNVSGAVNLGLASVSPNGALPFREKAKASPDGMFQFYITNAVAMNGDASSDGTNGLRYLFDTSPQTTTPSPTLSQQQLQSYSDQAEAGRDQPYWEAKRKLDNMVEFHKQLAAKIASEKLGMATPTASSVTIVDQAQPAQSENLRQNLTGKVESKARIEVNPDVTDIAAISRSPIEAGAGYDPYFAQATAEIIQSDAVLGKAVDALKLDESWSKENGGKKLSKQEAVALLKNRLDLKPEKNTKLIDIGVTGDKPEEAAKIANAVAEAYQAYRLESREQTTAAEIKTLQTESDQEEEGIRLAKAKVDRLGKESKILQADKPLPKPPANVPVPQPDVLTRENAFSTFSLNVSDVSFKLAEASLENGRMPDASSIRSEEFINAFDYRDPAAAAGQPVAFASERARDPFAQNRDLLRFSIKTAAAGRAADRPLNLALLLDTSGSMERADRVAIIREAMRVLTTQLHPQDVVSVVTFARTARLWADGVAGDKAGETLSQVGGITPEGGTNLEEAMRLAYETARRHYLANGINRVVLLTDGAANLGNVNAAALKQKVEAQRKQGIALDCFGIGWEDFNDDMLAELSGNGDGRYAFINSPEEAGTEFAAKLAGALRVAAQDVKVQVEFNPQRVISWRQIGYAKHQLTKEQFRDNSVIAAEISAQEAGNALYTVETKPDGTGPVATVYVRYKIPGTEDVQEHEWEVPYDGNAPALGQSSAAMRLAATAGAFSEWLAASPFAQEVSPDELLKDLSGVPQIYGADQRPKKLEWMIRQAKSLSGK